jgi:hypothetical protein
VRLVIEGWWRRAGAASLYSGPKFGAARSPACTVAPMAIREVAAAAPAGRADLADPPAFPGETKY